MVKRKEKLGTGLNGYALEPWMEEAAAAAGDEEGTVTISVGKEQWNERDSVITFPIHIGSKQTTPIPQLVMSKITDAPLDADVTLEFSHVYIKNGQYSIQCRVKYIKVLQIHQKSTSSSSPSAFGSGASAFNSSDPSMLPSAFPSS